MPKTHQSIQSCTIKGCPACAEQRRRDARMVTNKYLPPRIPTAPGQMTLPGVEMKFARRIAN